ncbi:Peptidase cysteine/serine trypsin-like protein [Lasiodiplodia theobromae]|uniref:Peptidase cysteine/serine trypsin-like protein n=1 Tax=Lasiodiplodia theobromae TaxID=45133 RepID=UPI0015C409B0|nr:Peptidase cysteine/serine trypsin-like protein [Lasiodiplodia theobromae]KAF4534387.1 Peptidase cysteine/serine trypsin-like protein [Lasiodiplodia theobromae]
MSKPWQEPSFGDLKIKDKIVEGEFRTGWPRLVPAPARIRPIGDPNTYIENYDEKRRRAFPSILRDEGVSYSRIRLIGRQSAGVDKPDPFPTLLVETTSYEGAWSNAVLKLVKALKKSTVKHRGPIHVEIVERGYDDPRVLPIEAYDTVLPIWRDDLGPSVVQTLAEFRVQWKLLSLVKMGCCPVSEFDRQARPPLPIMLVEAWDANEEVWEREILPRLKGLIADTRIANVEIWQAYEYGDNEVLNVTRLPERTWWERPLRIGDGLGPQGVPSIGTLGGFLDLEDRERKNSTTCILTSFNAVRNCSGVAPRSDSPPEKAFISRNITDPDPRPILKSPTDPDVERKIELVQREIEGLKREIYGEGQPAGSPPCIADLAEKGDQRAMEAVEVSRRMLAILDDQASKLSETTQFIAGSVRAVSGFAHHDSKKVALDWALVDVAPGRPVDLQFQRDNQLQGDLDLPFWTRREFSSWKKISSFKTGDVLKVGRATGWSSGQLNYAKAWLNFRKEEGALGGQQVYGTVVECMRIENPRGQRHPFSIGGDTGSMVLDADDGACIGLLFSGDEGETYGLMAPIEDVFYSVEEVTGCKVVKPQLISEAD